MNKKTVAIALIGLIILTQLVFAQIPSPLKAITISANLTFDSTGIFKYYYAITNPLINNGHIRHLEIDITKPLSSQMLIANGLVIQKGIDYQGKMLSSSFEETIAEIVTILEKPVIPVGAQTPSNWLGGIAVDGTISWGSMDEPFRIAPGQTLNGFVITSYGLPIIRDAHLEPAIDYDNLPEEYYENVELSIQLQDSLTYHAKTIGPTAPPEDFKPVEFLDNIIKMKHEAYTLGWIKNKGIEQSLDAKLENAKKKITQGKTDTAKEILKAFINEVEAQGCEGAAPPAPNENCPPGKNLTSEAYALLKYNALYLFDRL